MGQVLGKMNEVVIRCLDASLIHSDLHDGRDKCCPPALTLFSVRGLGSFVHQADGRTRCLKIRPLFSDVHGKYGLVTAHCRRAHTDNATSHAAALFLNGKVLTGPGIDGESISDHLFYKSSSVD